MVNEWPALQSWLELHHASIKRADVAYDDYEGKLVSIAWAVEQYQAEGFNAGGRKPRAECFGDWLDGDASTKGRTVGIGSRASGKYARCYEKGKQLGDPVSQWTRIEVEWRAQDRHIPYDILTRPGQYLAGAYPCLVALNELQSTIRTVSKAAQIAYDRAVENAKSHCGKIVNLMLAVVGGDYAEVVNQLIRPGIPTRRAIQLSRSARSDDVGSTAQGGGVMTLYKRKDSPYYWVKFSPIKGELKALMQSSGTANKRQAQQYHDKLQGERWEQDKLGVKPRRTWDQAAAKFLEGTSHKRTHEWDKSMLRWFQPHLGGKTWWISIGHCSTRSELFGQTAWLRRLPTATWHWSGRSCDVPAMNGNGSIACPKVGMMRDSGGRVRSLTRVEFARLLAQLPKHLSDMAQFSVATGLRQANVTGLQWHQISLERRHLWVSGAEHKNGRPHSVPLNQAAIDVLLKQVGDHSTRVFTASRRLENSINGGEMRARSA